MRLGDLPDLVNLACFEALADHGTYARAGAQVGLCDTAVCHRIATLERQLGVRLFDRRPGPGRQQLTAEGRELLPRARQALHHALELLDRAETGDEVPQREAKSA